MSPNDLKKANELLKNVEEINSTLATMRNNYNQSDWILSVTPDIDSTPSYRPDIVPAHIVVKCIKTSAITRLLEAERDGFLKQLQELGIDTKTLERSR